MNDRSKNGLTRWMVVVSLFVVPAAGAGPGDASADATVVAEVGDRKVLAVDLREQVAALRMRDVQQGRLEAFAPEAADKALQGIVDVKLLALKARKDGLDQRPDIRRRIESQVDELLAEAVVKEVSDTVATEDALRAYYQAHAAEFTTPGRVRARQLVVKTQPEAEALQERLKTGTDFAELARAHNVDSTKATGGELGWVARGTMVAAFDQALFALKVGEVSPIVHTSYGFHIIQVEEIEAGKLQDYDSVKESVRQKVIDARIAELKQQLMADYPVKVNKRVLEGLAK